MADLVLWRGVWVLLCLVGVLLLRCLFLLRQVRNEKDGEKSRKSPARTLVVLGSGGHTAEMMTILDGLSRAKYRPLLYVIARTDTTSKARVEAYEQKKAGSDYSFTSIPRSREVGQSWLTTVVTTAWASIFSFYTVFSFKPEVIITNGPGTCIPLCYSAFLLRALGLLKTKIVFVESFCRVRTLSLSGKLLYPIASRFVVGWEQLKDQYPSAVYLGQIF